LVNENGSVVAGPVDGVAAGAKVTFTDSVTFPTGRHVYTLKGQIGTDFANGDTIQASTTPSSDWTNVRGDITGDTITLTNGITEANTMTVKAGAVTVSVSSTPSSQNVVSGITNFTTSNIQFDATQSGEDVRFTSAQFRYEAAGTTEVTNCFAYDGATRLNNSAVNPTSAGAKTFTFNNSLTVPKGTVKTVAIKCDLPGNMTADETFGWGINSADTISGTGIGSSQTIAASFSTDVGPVLTVKGGGTLTVTNDSSTPSYAIAAGGSTGVTLGVLRFHATNEAMRLDRLAIQMSNVAATSSPSDLQQVTIWDGATQVGTAIFTGTSRNATSTLTSSVIIPQDGDKTLTIKGNLSAIGASQPGTQGALIQVDYDGDDSTGTRAIGQSSGATVNHSSTSDTAFDGVRVFRSYPTLAVLGVPTTALVSGTNVLYRFSVTANNSGLGIGFNELTANFATSSVNTLTNAELYAFTDSGFSTPVSGFASGLLVTVASPIIGANEFDLGSTVLQIPAGATYYFEIRADATLSGSGTEQISTKLLGDAAFPVGEATLMVSAADADATATNDQFIWSPNATTTSTVNHLDWTNGYGIVGLPAGGTNTVTLQKTN